MENVDNVRDRSYISDGPVKSLTGSFGVPKVVSEDMVGIRVVYDATKCGLNEAVWAPNFYLPTIDTSLRIVEFTSWFGDLDFEEFYLNYYLDPKIRAYTGVDMTDMDEHHKGSSTRV